MILLQIKVLLKRMSNSTLNLNIIPGVPDINKGDNIGDILISALKNHLYV